MGDKPSTLDCVLQYRCYKLGGGTEY